MAKDSPRTTAGELQKIVKSRGQKTFKKKCCLGGFQEKIILAHPKPNSSIFSYHN